MMDTAKYTEIIGRREQQEPVRVLQATCLNCKAILLNTFYKTLDGPHRSPDGELYWAGDCPDCGEIVIFHELRIPMRIV